MTEEEANFKLVNEEYNYFNNYSENCETTYCAVVKMSNNFSIKDDYYIEIGLTNFTVLREWDYKSMDMMIKERIANEFISNDFKDDYLVGNVIPVSSEKITLLSNSLKREKITGGCSVFYKNSDNKTGTAGAFFKLKNSEDVYMLSNRHVIVDPDCEMDTQVVHPSRMDSSNEFPDQVIGSIYWRSDKDDEFLDAAISKIDYPVEIGRYSLCRNLKFKSLGKAKLHQNVSKTGRSSGITFGEIRSINCTVNVTEKIEAPRFFKHQILSNNIAIDGDSGSVLVNEDEEVVGLIFASNKKTASFSNNINYIFNNKNIKDFSKFV